MNPEERNLMELLGVCWDKFYYLIGNGPSRDSELQEVRTYIHALQGIVCSVYAARMNPDFMIPPDSEEAQGDRARLMDAVFLTSGLKK